MMCIKSSYNRCFSHETCAYYESTVMNECCLIRVVLMVDILFMCHVGVMSQMYYI